MTIIDSSNPDLQVFAGDAYRLPFAEFHRIASMRPKSSVSYERGGKVYHLEQVADDQKLAKTPPLLARKVMRFRPVAVHTQLEHRH